MPTPNETIVTEEEQKKQDERFQELNKKPEAERTDDEKKELSEIKEHYGKRMQKRIDELNWKEKTAREELEKERKEKAELANRLKEVESQIPKETKKIVKDEFIEIGGKKYYTDEALQRMVQEKEISEYDAFKYQQDRLKEEAAERAYQRIKEEERREDEADVRKKTAEEVLREYPQFSKSHPDFNPNDPLYKLATEIFMEGYHANPRGLKLAITRAKEILRINDTHIDRTDDLNLDSGNPPQRRQPKEQEVTLTEAEKEAAERMFCKGDILNPKTQRAYTPNEAHFKALEAKKRRSER